MIAYYLNGQLSVDATCGITMRKVSYYSTEPILVDNLTRMEGHVILPVKIENIFRSPVVRSIMGTNISLHRIKFVCRKKFRKIVSSKEEI